MSPRESSQAPLFGLVLGGGKSRRMGTDKAVLHYHGRPQFAVAFDLMAGFCIERFVSLRAEQAAETTFAGYPHLLDAYPGEGPLAAVVSAQMQKPGVAWLVLACDLPFLDQGTLADLVTQRDANRNATGYLSQNDGRIEPLCAIYEPSSAPLLAQAYTAGLRCARKGLESVSPLSLTLPKVNALENANTPSDRESFMSQLQSGSHHDERVQAEPNPAQTESRPVRVTLYAQLRESLGRDQVVALRLPASEGEVLRQLGACFPAQASLIARCRIAVQDAYLLEGEKVPQVEDLDLIAPVSGG
jgi:molybdenum cofactor guanylyltransferase